MRRLALGACLGLGLAAGPVGGAAAPEEGAREPVALALEVEKSLLEGDLRDFHGLAARRGEVETRLGQLRQAIDAAVDDRQAAESRRLDQLAEQLQRVAGERRALFDSEAVLLGRIGDRRRRIALLEQQMASLAGRSDEQVRGQLSGTWDLVLLPLEQRGSCELRQEGAVVSGTYELAGGWSGSLQGTLVDRKVFFVRIDSKLGKMMELEGYLSADGRRIRGSWLNYELAGSAGATGQWSAERRPAKP